jgi:hypothetical protein
MRLAKEIERAFAEIRQAVDAATPEELRGVIERYVGPLVLEADGEIKVIEAQKEGASEDESTEAHRTELVAGADSDSVKEQVRKVELAYR